MNENTTIQEIFDTLNDEQKRLAYFIVGWSIEHKKIHPLIKQY